MLSLLVYLHFNRACRFVVGGLEALLDVFEGVDVRDDLLQWHCAGCQKIYGDLVIVTPIEKVITRRENDCLLLQHRR